MIRGDGLIEAWTYNSRIQPASISVGSAVSPASVLGLSLYYCPSKDSFCNSNNGNLQTESLGVLGIDQNFMYDTLNRLGTANEATGSAWAQTFDYDAFGNRWVVPGSYLPNTAFTPTTAGNFNATTNRLGLNNSAYDFAGNQTAIGGFAFQYDAENRQVEANLSNGATPVSSNGYAYDGEGRRVQKITCPAGTSLCTPSVAGATVINYVYDAFGNLAAEYAISGPLQALACTRCYLSVDHLGSTRALTDGTTGGVIERHDYLPFGEEIYAGTGGRTAAQGYLSIPDPIKVRQRFTGKERESETNLDYFGARYFSGAQGRFTSPDLSNMGVDFWLPQTWNRYAYALNNPLHYTDDNGLWPTPGHDVIIDQAFPGLTWAQRQILKNASYATDNTNQYQGVEAQDPAASPVHGMSNGLTNQDIAAAEAEGDAFIAQNQQGAQMQQAAWIASGHKGLCPSALTMFGNGLHTVTDRTSPEHRGNQPWFGTKGRKNIQRAIQHLLGESIFMWPSDRGAGVQAAQYFFFKTFGSDAYVTATEKKEVVTSTICAPNANGTPGCQ